MFRVLSQIRSKASYFEVLSRGDKTLKIKAGNISGFFSAYIRLQEILTPRDAVKKGYRVLSPILHEDD